MSRHFVTSHTNQSRRVTARLAPRLHASHWRALLGIALSLSVGLTCSSTTHAEDDYDDAVPAEQQMILRGQQIFLRGQQVGRIALDRGQVRQIAIQQIAIDNDQIQVVVVIDGVEHFQNEDQRTASETAARKRFDLQLDSQIQAMERLYSLTEAQKKKLQLAGKGDIHQHFDRLAEMRARMAADSPRGEPFHALVKEHQNSMRGGLFGEDSLYQKTLRTMLTGAQRERYLLIGYEQQRRLLESVMQDWDRAADRFKLWGEPRKKFIELLVPHLHVPTSAGSLSHQIVFLEAWRLREQVRPLLTADEWEKFVWQVDRAKEMVPMLEARGLWTAGLADDVNQAADTTKE